MIRETELKHYGIKGMKWGIRRYQKKDGTLTNAGQKRYADDSKNLIERHKQNLINKYTEKGYSKNDAKIMASQRMRTEAVLAVAGGVAVGILAKKAMTRIGQDYCDKIIKSGKEIQNIGASGLESFKTKPFHAAMNKHDKRAYGSMYPFEKRLMGNENIYKNQIKVTKDIKRASVNNARKIFYDKMNKDQEFKNEVLDTIKKTAYGRDADNLLKNNPKKFYDRFNQALATPEFQSNLLNRKFYSELEKHGYGAILDINDTRYSGYKKISKDPTIIFGTNVVEKLSSTKLADEEINANHLKYSKELVAKALAKTSAEYGAAFGIGRSIGNQKYVERYIKEHPNTKLSREEILKTKNK